MATVVKPLDSGLVAVHITLDGLASTASRQSDAIDNTANNATYGLADEFEVFGQFQTASGTLGSFANVSIYPAGRSVGANYADGLTGSDAAFTVPSTPVARPFAVPISTSATLTYLGSVLLTPLLGGRISKFAFFVQNNTGLALAAAPATSSVSGVTNTTNPTITTSTAHGRAVGDTVTISGVVGATGVNGTWVVASVGSSTTFTITLGTVPGAYTSGGTVAPALNTIQLLPVQYQAV